jgi:hypothetical protein
VTHNPIRVLEDGTRVYSNGVRRKPKPDSERIYKRRKPDTPGAVLWQGNWLLPLAVLPPASRVMPTTRPDTDAYDHASKPRKCRCDVCKRPESRRWRNQWRREQRSGVVRRTPGLYVPENRVAPTTSETS